MSAAVDDVARGLRPPLTADAAALEADRRLSGRLNASAPCVAGCPASVGVSSAPPVYVVTCSVPPRSCRQLRVEIAGRALRATGPNGFGRTFELPPNVAIDALQWDVYMDILELRAPLRGAAS